MTPAGNGTTTVKVTTGTAATAPTALRAKGIGVSEEVNMHGVPRSRIAELTVGDEILIGPDFHATILAVRDGKFDIETEYGRLIRITASAIEALP